MLKRKYVQDTVIINLRFVNDIKFLTNFEKNEWKFVRREYLFPLRQIISLMVLMISGIIS